MANPYSGYGISDRDYAATVAALAGEMSPKAKQDDVDRILDSIVNRAEQNSARRPDGTVERASLGSVVTASGQYDAMRGIGNRDRGNARTNGGQRAAREAFVGALAPSKLSPEARTRVEMANKAIENVVVSGVSRGIAQGATDYRNAALTDRWGTGGMHRTNENVYGSLEDTTGHRFSGPGFNPDMEFDPVSLHGQLQDIGLPAELSGLTAPEVSLPAPDLPGALHGLETPDYSGITQGIPGLDPMQGFRVDVPNVPPADWTMPDRPFDVSLANLGLANQRPSENIDDRRGQPPSEPEWMGLARDLLNDPNASVEDKQLAEAMLHSTDYLNGVADEMAGVRERNLLNNITTPIDTPLNRNEQPLDYGKEYPDISAGMYPDYSDITAGLYGEVRAPDLPSTPDVMSQFDGPTYPDMSSSMYGGPPAKDVSVPSVPDVGGLSLDNYGPNIGEMGYGVSGHHAGEDFGPADLANINSQTTAAQQNYDTAQRNYDTQKAAYDRDMKAYDQATKSFSPNSHYTNDVLNAPLGTIGMSGLTAFGFDLPAGMKVNAPAPEKLVAPEKPVAPQRPAPAPVTPKALPSQDIGAPPALSSSFASAPTSLGDVFGAGQHGFDGFLAGIGARDQAAMDAVDKAGMGYAAGYAMGDGPYATMGTNDLQDRFGKEFGMDARKGVAEGFKQDYGQLSPTARGGLEGGLKGLAMGGPLGMLGGGILGALGGYALPNGLSGLFDGTFGTGLERGTPGNMSNFGSPYDGAGLAGPYDSLFGGAPGAAGNVHDMQAIQDAYDARNGGGLGGLFDGGSFGGDPSQDGGARYAG